MFQQYALLSYALTCALQQRIYICVIYIYIYIYICPANEVTFIKPETSSEEPPQRALRRLLRAPRADPDVAVPGLRAERAQRDCVELLEPQLPAAPRRHVLRRSAEPKGR